MAGVSHLVSSAPVFGGPTQVAAPTSVSDPLFLATATATIVCLALVFRHASTREEYGFVLTGIVWGYLLEQAALSGYEPYVYNTDRFVLTLFDVPLEVAFTWAALFYAGWQTGRYLGLSRGRLPFFVGLFVLHVDLAIDAIAIRVPLWTWTTAGAWYGVPLKNFWGWWSAAFLLVGCYVVFERWIRRPELRFLLLVPTSFAALTLGTGVYRESGIGPTAEVLVTVAIVLGSLLVVVTDDLAPERIPRPITGIPMLFHGFFLGVGLWLGTFAEHPVLLAMSLAMLLVSVGLHALPRIVEHRQRWVPA